MTDRLKDSFAGGPVSLASHVADTGQTWRGGCRLSGQVNAGVYGVGCCSGNYREARADGIIYDNFSHHLDFQRGTSGIYWAGLVVRAEAGNLNDDNGARGRILVWFRPVNTTTVEVGFVQYNTAGSAIQGAAGSGQGLVQFAWAQNTWMRLRARVQGDVLTAFRSDAFGSANEVQLFQVTLANPFNDPAHNHAGWFNLDYGSGAAHANLLLQDEVPPVTVLNATPTSLTFESYDEVQPPPQDVALDAINGPATGLATTKYSGIVKLTLTLDQTTTPATLTVAPDVVGEGINPGVYPCVVRVTAANAPSPLDIPVTVEVDTPWSEGRPDASGSSWQAVP
jgi:hypothetical protein